MELRYPVVMYIGCGVVLLLAAFIFIRFKKQKKYKGGKKVINTLIENDAYYKKKVVFYKVFTGALLTMCLVGILGAFFMFARPYKTKVVPKEEYNRDIILCIDISSSVDALNARVIDELKDVVETLKGERFGVVIFNTSPIMLVPLTNDYEYVIEELDVVKQALEMRSSYDSWGNLPDNWMYLYEYISAGTLVGNEDRGSSLIGDGLASAVYNFNDIEEDRAKIIIFTTDNDLQGQPLVTMPEAGEIAKKKNVTVYGVGTKEMYDKNLLEMKSTVEVTGGKFYLEEESGTFKQIIDNINSESKGLIQTENEVKKVEKPMIPFIIVLISAVGMIVLTKVTRR